MAGAASCSQFTRQASQVSRQTCHSAFIEAAHESGRQRYHGEVVIDIDDGIVRVNVACRHT